MLLIRIIVKGHKVHVRSFFFQTQVCQWTLFDSKVPGRPGVTPGTALAALASFCTHGFGALTAEVVLRIAN